MSDFDKEAEREKLREKYERDKEKREATEQMSELLLKGATMTNAHCGTCGDPIFRYDGQEFCPTCEEVVTDPEDAPDGEAGTEAADAHEPAADDTAATDADTNGTADQPAGPPTSASGSTAADETASTADRTAPETGGQTNETDAATSDTEPTRTVPSADPGDTTARVSTAPETVTSGDTPLASARASLARTVTELAKEAEQSGDLERVRAYLAATEEAADALAAVKRADR